MSGNPNNVWGPQWGPVPKPPIEYEGEWYFDNEHSDADEAFIQNLFQINEFDLQEEE